MPPRQVYECRNTTENKRWQTTVPHVILSIVSDLLPLSDFIKFRSACLHWRSAPSCRSNITELSKKDPWCIFYDFDARDKDMCLFYQCNDRRSCHIKLSGLRRAQCFVSKHGWLFIHQNNDYLFFNPLTLEEKFLPKYPVKSFESSVCQVGIFSTSPSSKECIVIVLSSRDCSTIKIASCHLTANKWMVNAMDFGPYSVACDSVLLQSPKYVYFSVVKNVSQPSNRPNNIFICYGNHFLIFDFLGKRYEISSLLRRQSIKKGVDKCLKITNWYSKLKEVHSDDWICKLSKEFTCSFCLFNYCKGIEDEKVFGTRALPLENKGWQTTVPHDILSIISDLLPLSDFINFRGVCRHWRSAPSCRSNITELSKKDPWCIFYDFDARDKDMCLFYQCNDRRSCRVKMPGLRGAKCFVSKHGWLFIHRNNDYLFFNPLTLEEKFLPKYPVSLGYSACQVGTFSASPSSKECIAIVLSSKDCSTVKIASCHLTANKWEVNTFKFGRHSVACVSELLPSPKYVYFSVVNNFLRPSKRPNKIFICYDTHFLIFDLLGMKCKISSFLCDPTLKNSVDNLKITNWYSKLKEVHSDDWICTFGEEFTFSFCLFNDCKGIEDKKVFGADYQTIPNIPVIKAAWL